MRPRSLRTKVSLAMVSSAAALLVLSLGDLAVTTIPKFRDLDDRFAGREHDRVWTVARLQLRAAARTARDWAVWDPMEAWLRHPDTGADFARENLRTRNLSSLGWSGLLLFGPGGEPVVSLWDSDSQPVLGDWARRRARAWASRRDTALDTGVTRLDGRFWGVVVQPVRRMAGGAPGSGLLVGAWPLDLSLAAREEFELVSDSLPADTAIDSMSFAVELPALAGLPRPHMSIHRAREVWWRGLLTVGEISLVVAFLGCLAVLALSRLFERLFLRRLERLRSDLATIQERPGPGARVAVDGSGDDIDRVAGQVNSTLGALDEVQSNLADARRIARLGFWQLDLETMRAHISAEHVETADLHRLVQPLELSFGEYLDRFVHPEDRERMRSWAEFARARSDQVVERDIEYRTVGHNGEVRHLSAACRRRSGEGKVLFLVAQDVTERRRMEDELLRGSLYDTLTGLPNRNLVFDRLSGALARSGGGAVSLLVLDVDRFGAVNASLGRDIGDGVLLGLAVRLVGALPPGTTVGRMAHHEFGVLVERDHEEIDRIAETLRLVARTPLPLGGRELVLTGSVGVASASAGECLAEELISRAESAAYSASARGGDGVSYFDEERSRQARERVEMEIDLAKAIGSELELHYQPIVRLDSGRLAGFEALVRWRHPVRGLIPPVVFIPIAERSGLIHELGLWVLEEAMRREASWQARLGDRAPFMSINLSVRQFHHDDLAERILDTVARTGVHPDGVKLEITESALSEDPLRVAELLERLCSTGLRFSLDDFGTGYSSLGYLSRFPVQTLKVDKSFVDELGQDEKKTRITSAIVTLAHSLDMDVVAEGIETDIQRERLLALGCEFGQGYLFSRPLPGPMAEEYLAR